MEQVSSNCCTSSQCFLFILRLHNREGEFFCYMVHLFRYRLSNIYRVVLLQIFTVRLSYGHNVFSFIYLWFFFLNQPITGSELRRGGIKVWLYNTHKRAGENLVVSFADSTRTISQFNINLNFKVRNLFCLYLNLHRTRHGT